MNTEDFSENFKIIQREHLYVFLSIAIALKIALLLGLPEPVWSSLFIKCRSILIASFKMDIFHTYYKEARHVEVAIV